jgi:NADH-quinone oxidoreductase subunit M
MRELLLSMGVDQWILPALVVWPLVAAPLVRLLGRDRWRDEAGMEAPAGGPDARVLTLGALCVELVFALLLWMVFEPGKRGWQARVDVPWIADLGASISLGVDGMSLAMVLMTALVLPLTLLGSWNNVRVRTPSFGALALLLTSGLIGVFVSLDLLLFYLMWELMLIPTYLLVGIWSAAGQSRAALRYVLFTLVGSLLMLVAIVALWNLGGSTNFHYDHLSLVVLSPRAQLLLFGAFFVAFAVKSALVPFHTWLPDAQAAAPTFAAVTIGLKVGAYAILRFAIPLFPSGATFPWLRSTILILSVIAILYGALVAMAQRDFKRMISYSSISHLGFIMLGAFALTTESLQGAVMSIVNSGITTSALFLLAGMLEDRKGTTDLAAFGGLARVMPLFAIMVSLSMLSTIGLPGTNGFVGEFLVLIGTFEFDRTYGLVATLGVIVAAAYGLRGVQRLIYDRLDDSNATLTDLGTRERVVMGVFAALIVYLGVAPGVLLSRTDRAAVDVLEAVQFGPNAPVTLPPFSLGGPSHD